MGEFWRDFLDHDPKPTPGDRALVVELRHQFFDQVDRRGKADTGPPGDDRGVNPHDFAPRIEEWSTTIARIDRGVGLNKIVVLPGPDDPALGANDTGGHRVRQAKRIANGQHPLANAQGVRIA